MDQALIVRLYHEQPLSVDKLPYTDQFNHIVNEYNRRHPSNGMDHQMMYRTLVNMRKNKKLIRKTTRTLTPRRFA